jgi:hypothetical protein
MTSLHSLDARYKKDVVVIENALDKTSSLNGILYTDTENRRRTGPSAQDAQKVLPEAVDEGSNGKLMLAYPNLVGLLVESIKELKARVEKVGNTCQQEGAIVMVPTPSSVESQ